MIRMAFNSTHGSEPNVGALPCFSPSACSPRRSPPRGSRRARSTGSPAVLVRADQRSRSLVPECPTTHYLDIVGFLVRGLHKIGELPLALGFVGSQANS